MFTVFDKAVTTVAVFAGIAAVVSIPLILRKVPRNVVYGYRTRATLSDDTLWYEANACFGRWLLGGTIVGAALFFLLYAADVFDGSSFIQASIVALVAPVMVAMLCTTRLVGRMRSEGDDRRPPLRR